MDPDKTLELLIRALGDDATSRDEWLELSDNLHGWHTRGGFLPRFPASTPVDWEKIPGSVAFQLGRVCAALDNEDRGAYTSAMNALRMAGSRLAWGGR